MPEVRRAGPDDAAELTRLRIVMFADMGRDLGPLDEDWRRRNVAHSAAGWPRRRCSPRTCSTGPVEGWPHPPSAGPTNT